MNGVFGLLVTGKTDDNVTWNKCCDRDKSCTFVS